MSAQPETPEVAETTHGRELAARHCSAVRCHRCGTADHVFTWERDITHTGVHLLGHYCKRDEGGCGLHFDSEYCDHMKHYITVSGHCMGCGQFIIKPNTVITNAADGSTSKDPHQSAFGA